MKSLATSDPLGKAERLLREGRPSHFSRSTGTRALWWLGRVMGAGFAVLLLLGFANLGEMGGFLGVWLALVVLNAAGFGALAFRLPAVVRRGMRGRRYAVTQRALLVAANAAVRRREIKPGLGIEERNREARARDVLFEFPARRMVYAQGRATGRRNRSPARGFRRLTEADPKAALAAIGAAQISGPGCRGK